MDVGLWLRFSRGTISLVRTMGSTGQASLSPSVWGTFGTTEPVAFLEPGKDATYALSPTRMQVSNATNSDLQFFILFFYFPSCLSGHLAGPLTMGLLPSDGFDILR